ncbi:MAG: HEPN domain-containing protein [Niameybacter sp.]|uniref:HEPN domain-containing protein n=1 Tax=Niameybacter sp. TaxID=2033640 RepID=UPI002FC8EFEC
MNRSMIDFANTDYELIQHIKEVKGMEDPTIVNCQQCAEKYLKHLVREHAEEVMRTHSISAMIAKLDEKFPELQDFKHIARFLTDSYYDRRYESEDYVLLEPDEYDDYLSQSLELIAYLRKLCGIS